MINVHGSTWKTIEDYINKKITTLHQENEDPGTNDIETAVIRGQIIFAREILAMPMRSEKIEAQDETYIE